MLKFVDGPAKGKADGLIIRRAPTFLRVVHNERENKWDALDQTCDKPTYEEKIYAYRKVAGTGSSGFACRRGQGGSGQFEAGHYVLIEPQPEEKIMRTWHTWVEWVTSWMVENGYADHPTSGRPPSSSSEGDSKQPCSSPQ